jgi:hypothetical protein
MPEKAYSVSLRQGGRARVPEVEMWSRNELVLKEKRSRILAPHSNRS